MYDVIVIGSGIAGMTSAIYLSRANKKVLILESFMPGGQLNKISTIENYPGFINIDGPTLAMNVYEQMNKLNIEYKSGVVTEIINSSKYKIVKTKDNEYETHNIIIATGRVPKKLGLKNELDLIGRGISYCSICDGPLYKNKTVMVVGGGNSALEQALYLSAICKKVILVHRRDEFRGEDLRKERVLANSNIEIHYNSEITKINKLTEIIDSVELNNQEIIKIDGLFVAIGYLPNFVIKNDLDIKMSDGYIVVDKNMETSVSHIYACGDIIQKQAYQLSIAIGEGALAALSIINNE